LIAYFLTLKCPTAHFAVHNIRFAVVVICGVTVANADVAVVRAVVALVADLETAVAVSGVAASVAYLVVMLI